MAVKERRVRLSRNFMLIDECLSCDFRSVGSALLMLDS